MQDRMKVPELEDAVVNVARSLGSNGRGKGGVGGHMMAMASKHPKRFAPLLEMALRLKQSARPDEDYEWRGGQRMWNRKQLLAYFKEYGLPEMILDHLPIVPTDELPPLDDGPPSSATDFLDAIIAAARRYGSNGRGKDGVEGYILMLARMGCRTFDRWVIQTMVEQVEDRYRGHELSPEERADIEARMREEVDSPAMRALDAYLTPEPELDDDEIEDPWGVGAKDGIRQRPSIEPDPARPWNRAHPSRRPWQRPGRGR